MTCFLLSLALSLDEQSRQPTKGKKSKDIFTLLAEVIEMKTIATERETSLQRIKENEELGKMIKQCQQMNLITVC